MTNDNLLPFSFPAVSRKQVTAACDGGRLTSDGGVMLLAMAERRPGIADRLACCFPGRRDPTRITSTLAAMIRARIFAISPGYEDADDLDFLRTDPAFKLSRRAGSRLVLGLSASRKFLAAANPPHVSPFLSQVLSPKLPLNSLKSLAHRK